MQKFISLYVNVTLKFNLIWIKNIKTVLFLATLSGEKKVQRL